MGDSIPGSERLGVPTVLSIAAVLLVVSAAAIGYTTFVQPASGEPSVQVGDVDATDASTDVEPGGLIESFTIDFRASVEYENVKDRQHIEVDLWLDVPGVYGTTFIDRESVDVSGDGEVTVEFGADVLNSSSDIDASTFAPGDDGVYEEEITAIVMVGVVDPGLENPSVAHAEATDTFTLEVREQQDDGDGDESGDEAVIVSFYATVQPNVVGDADEDA